MARQMKKGAVVEMARTYFPSFLASRQQAIRLDQWMSGRQATLHNEAGANSAFETDVEDPTYGKTFSPAGEASTDEYDNLQTLAPNGFAGLVVATLSQTAYIESIRRPGVKGKLPAWNTFRQNRLLAKQTSIHRNAIGLSQSFGVVIPGKDPLTGEKMSKILLRSPKRMAAFYDTDDDEWPRLALEATPRWERLESTMTPMMVGWDVIIWDSYVFHILHCKGNGLMQEDWTYIESRDHGIPVPPVTRCVNRIDLDGRTTGEIEPVLPLLRRIDQDVFDRLITQRFGAWQVRYISGMAKPTKQSDEIQQAIKLRQSDLLVSTNEKTKFGVLPGGPLAPHIEATDADLRLLAAITQTPPHHLLGLSSNLQAEALAAAESGLQRKAFDFKSNADQFYIDLARLDAMVRGDMASAVAYDYHIGWRDTESRSMTQAADALGKLAVQLKVPLEMLWEKIPGWTDDDVERAKELIEDGTFEKLVQELMDGVDAEAQAEGAAGAATSGDSN